jgi:hypothetical protein
MPEIDEPTVSLPLELFELILTYVENAARGDNRYPEHAMELLGKLRKLGIYQGDADL